MKYGARDREETRLQVRKQDTKLEKFLARILRKYALSSLHIMGSFLEKLTFFRGFFSQNYCVTTLFQTTVTNFQLVRDLFYFLQLFIVVHTYVKYINKRADLIHRFLETPIFFFCKEITGASITVVCVGKQIFTVQTEFHWQNGQPLRHVSLQSILRK